MEQGRASASEGQVVPSIWIILYYVIYYYILDIGSMGVMLIWSEHLPTTGSCNPLRLREHLRSAPQALCKKSSESLHAGWCLDKSIRSTPQRQPSVDATQWRCWADTELPRQPLATLCSKDRLDSSWWWKDHVYTSCSSQIPITGRFAPQEEKQNSSSVVSLTVCTEE